MSVKATKLTDSAKGRFFNAHGGCNEDCANCPYPDCYKPLSKMKMDKLAKSAKRIEPSSNESQARMFTLELGGVGKNFPNISKKFYV